MGSALSYGAGYAIGYGVGAAVGSAVSQGVAIAIDQQESFSWKGVGASALSAGLLQGTDLGNLFDPSWYQVAAQSVVNNAVTQGVSIALGLQESFSWRDVAISTVSAPLAGRAMRIVGGVIPNATLAGIGAHVAAGATSALVRRAFGGRMDTDTVLADVFGNALGNSIVDAMQPTAGAAAASSQANRGGSSAGTSRSVDQLEEVQITARRLDNNPTNTIRAGSEISPDEISAAAAPPAGGIETVFSTAPRWRLGEELIYQDLWLTSLSSGIRPNGDYLAAKAQDTYVDNIQRQNTAMLISGFTPIGQIPLVVEGAVNLLGKAASGILALPALGGGLDRAAAVQERFEDNLRIDLDTRFFDAFGQSLAPGLNRVHGALEDTIGIGPTAALGALAEFGLDASAVLGAGAAFRGVAPGAVNTPLWAGSSDS